jgi:hypothetical protein
MKKCYGTLRLIVILFAVCILGFAPVYAGPGYEYSRGELMGNSGLAIFRVADFGYQNGLSLYIDGIPITTLSLGEGYRAIVRPGRHRLTVTNTPSPYGKTMFTHRTVDFAPGQNYAFTAIWDVDALTIEDGGYVYHGFYR